MGVGNFYLDDSCTVYILNDEIYPEDEDGCIQYDHCYLDNVKEDILSNLPNSYFEADNWYENGKVIAENGHYLVVTNEWEGYLAVSIVVKEPEYWEQAGLHRAAQVNLEKRATSIFNKLDKTYDLHIRCGPWTSGRYQQAA